MFIWGSLGRKHVHPLLELADILYLVQILHFQGQFLYSVKVRRKAQMVGLVTLN